MNKSLMILSVLVWVMSTPALSAPCANGAGRQVIGVDGETYCASHDLMNWWSAHAWCEAANMKLISLDRCNGKNGNITGDSRCPNFKGRDWSTFWTSSVPDSNRATYFHSGDGHINTHNRNDTDAALCE